MSKGGRIILLAEGVSIDFLGQELGKRGRDSKDRSGRRE